ncbi:MAG: hypothetical protein AB7U73_00100 [Pirellulales bacterium]
MPCTRDEHVADEPLPRWWRLLMIAAATIVFCSCARKENRARGAEPVIVSDSVAIGDERITATDYDDEGYSAASSDEVIYGMPSLLLATPDGLPEAAFRGTARLYDEMGLPWEPLPPGVPPLPFLIMGPWTPPGFGNPWPWEEYLHDGGDRDLPVKVDADWHIYGLNVEDTIAHYDTLDGRRKVTPSNCVHIYSPRFGAIRKVIGATLNEHIQGPHNVDRPAGPELINELLPPLVAVKDDQPLAQEGLRVPTPLVRLARDGAVSQVLQARELKDALLPYEDLGIIRTGEYIQAEKAYLAEGLQAAIAWTDVQAVQVLLEHQAANEVVGDRRVQATYLVEHKGCPALRLCKVASTQFALPGETVDFTLRFDNVGDETIGNVTIVDNLTARLEYVADSAQASVKANFSTETNTVGSLVLRWEIIDPLEPGEGGIAHFRCRVR